MKNEPCFRCTLPDCDETSPRCGLRRAANQVHRKWKRGLAHEITREELDAYNAHFRIWKLEDLAKRSEARS